VENHVDAAKRTRDKSETNLQRAPPRAHKSPPARCRRSRAGGPVIYPQKFGVQSVRIPAGSRTAATCRRSPRANHHPVNPQQAAEPI